MPLDPGKSISNLLSFRNLDSVEDLTGFIQSWSSCLTFPQLQNFIITLIPFVNPKSAMYYQPQALIIQSATLCAFGQAHLEIEKVRFLKKVFKDIISFQMCNLPLNKNQHLLSLDLEAKSPWNHLADLYQADVSSLEYKQCNLLSSEDYRRNALISSLFLSLLSDLSLILRSDFESFLIQGLYPILEKLGN
jgi:hypothetical protein